jgi:hypothetical protein
MKVSKIAINWNPELSIYASEPFLKAVSNEYGWLGGMDDSGAPCCILPYTIVKKAMVRMVRFRVETIPMSEDFGLEKEQAFLESAVEYFRSLGADMIIPATTNTIFRTYPKGAAAAPYGTYIIDLRQTEDILWSNLHSKHRNVIRNAMKKGVEIHSGNEFAEKAYNIERDTFKRSAMSFMKIGEFMNIINGLGKNVKVFIADYQGTAQGCAIVPYSKHTAYYVYGGTAPNPLTGATNMLQWEAIKYFSKQGVKRYDFCGARINPEKGSKAAGLVMFKERFGPQLIQGYMWKYSINPIKSTIYSLAVRWLRGGDIVDAERHKLLKPQ